MNDLIKAGRSDKYGQVYVERMGSSGFSDPGEPVAVLRAEDVHAWRAMQFYKSLIDGDPKVGSEQRQSVARQVYAFQLWQIDHPHRVRIPGSPASRVPYVVEGDHVG